MHNSMLYPMLVMIGLTVVIGGLAVKARFASVREGRMDGKFYKLMQGGAVDERVAVTTRSFDNQFQVPMLFYVAATLHIVMQAETTLALGLAWLFVASRIMHACIHLTYNHVLHRLAAFEVGVVAVLALWIHLLVRSL